MNNPFLRLHLNLSMPAKNIVKTYTENGYYHVYNRGVEKRDIFMDEEDCQVFLHYLKIYLSPKEELEKLILSDKKYLRLRRFIPLNLSSELDLLAFTTMPNHFHLEIKQYSRNAMSKLLQRLTTSYVMYFNRKYNRIGCLFQGTYKASLVESDAYLLYLSRYIHLNARDIKSAINFIEYSSYPYYLGIKRASWIKPQEILTYFKSTNNNFTNDLLSYQSFIEDNNTDPTTIIGDLTLE